MAKGERERLDRGEREHAHPFICIATKR